MSVIITAVISGGQTGADLGGLEAAFSLGISTGGMAPAGYRTEDGPNLDLHVMYNLLESDYNDYSPRTQFNVEHSDGTLIFGRRSQGSNLTEGLCEKFKKPFRWVFWTPSVPAAQNTNPKAIRLWLVRNNIKVLNVAGNRESKNTGIGQFTKQFMIEVLR